MKKITIKISAFLFFTVFALQLQAQGNSYTTQTDGVFKIKVEGQDLYLTLPDLEPPVFGAWEQIVTYQPLNSTKPELQTFNVTYRADDCTSCYFIESAIPGRGLVELMNPGSQTAPLVVKGNTAAAPSLDGLDRWNVTRGSGTEIFSENTCTTCGWSGAKRRVQAGTGGPTSGDEVKVNGGTGQKFSWEAVSLSAEKFDTSSILISNPVGDELTIKGITSNINTVSVYSLLGERVLSSKVDNQSEVNLDVTALTSGMYIVEMESDSGKFSKKILKK